MTTTHNVIPWKVQLPACAESYFIKENCCCYTKLKLNEFFNVQTVLTSSNQRTSSSSLCLTPAVAAACSPADPPQLPLPDHQCSSLDNVLLYLEVVFSVSCENSD